MLGQSADLFVSDTGFEAEAGFQFSVLIKAEGDDASCRPSNHQAGPGKWEK
jgi:hypothetical protein